MPGAIDKTRDKLRNGDAELLQRSVAAFQDATGLQLDVDLKQPAKGKFRHADGQVCLTGAQSPREPFPVEIKARLTPATLGLAVEQMQQLGQKGLIVTDYVNPNMAERLKEMDIGFIDATGNAYINAPPVFVYVRGNKPPEHPSRQLPTRAFQPTGLKVVFAFLCRPGLENAPYRGIAAATGVALGTVNWVITDLKELGFLKPVGRRRRRLIRQEELLDRWVTAYPEQLRPKLLIGRYRAPDQAWWTVKGLQDYNAYWGGEVAGTVLTRHLKPEQATIYTRSKPAKLLHARRLRADPGGDVEILDVFWPESADDDTHPGVAPALLVYADLLATGDARNIETARIIREKELARLIRED